MPRDLEITEGGGNALVGRHPSDLEAALDWLGTCDDVALTEAWLEHFGAEPPSALPTRLLRFAIAYDLQARAIGGLSQAVERRLARIAADDAAPMPVQATSVRLKPGATLMRDWNGQTYRVEVLADGKFSFEGRTWRSLSAIARKITGASRNGPAFFGLREGRTNGSK